MKKVKLLAATLTVAVMLTGAGYAYWTDSLKINNTVSTGEMNVEFVDGGIGHPWGIASQYLTATASQDDPKTTTIAISDMHPGSVAALVATFENKGTIPVVFDNVDVTFDDTNTDQELKDNLFMLAGYFLLDKNNNYKGGNLISVNSLNELETQLNTLFSGLRLEPGDHVVLDVPDDAYDTIRALAPGWEPTEGNSLYYVLPYYVDNSDNVEDKSAKFDIKINWKQHNA